MPVAVESTAIAAASTATQSVGSMAKGKTHTRIGIERSIAATLCTCLYGGMLFLACNDVDGTAEALSAIDTAGGSLKHLDALYVAHAHGEVCCKMSCVGIADVDTVKKDRNLIKDATINGDVRLNTKATTLTDIHACDQFEQIVDTLHPRLFNILALEYTHDTCRLQLSQRSHGATHGHLVDGLCLLGLLFLGIYSRSRTQTSFCLGSHSQCGHTEHSDSYLAMQAGKSTVPMAGKLPPGNDFWLLNLFVVHWLNNYK